MGWKVYFFETGRGDRPVEQFILKQPANIRARINQSIFLLINRGPFLKPPYMKKLQDKIYELRIKSHVAIRIFYSPKDGTYYLLHAFKKKSQKTPAKELRIALDRMRKII